MKKKTYAEQLKDPRWQKKRLEVLQHYNFTCTLCSSDKKTLHVHHGYYGKNRNVWEYNLETLWCLCSTCHKITEETMDQIKLQIGEFNPSILTSLLSILTELSLFGFLSGEDAFNRGLNYKKK